MGVDCMMFAEKAKKCIWIDRRYNVPAPCHERFSGDWWLGYMAGLDYASKDGGIWQSADGSVSGCNWAKDTAIGNRGYARDFIRKHGAGDSYFIITDHDEPSCHEYAETNGFTRDDK